MSLPFSDSFTGTTGTALTTYSANYTYEEGTFEINSNNVRATSTNSIARVNSATFSNDGYAQMTVSAVAATGSPRYLGAAYRVATGAATCYAFLFGGTASASQRRLVKRVAGTTTELASDTTPANVGDVFRIECEGTTIRGKVNGTTVFSVTDSSITSGAAGIFGNGATSGHRGDNFEAGDLSTSVTVTPGVASLSLTKFTPSVLAPRTFTPGVQSLSTTPAAPTVSVPRTFTPGVASLGTTPFAPAILAPRVLTPGVKNLIVTPLVPSVERPLVATPGTRTLGITTYQIDVIAPGQIIPGPASLTLTLLAPSMLSPRTIVPGPAPIVASTFAPSIERPIVIVAGTGAIAIAAYRPIVTGAAPSFQAAWAVAANTLIR